MRRASFTDRPTFYLVHRTSSVTYLFNAATGDPYMFATYRKAKDFVRENRQTIPGLEDYRICSSFDLSDLSRTAQAHRLKLPL